MELQHRQVDTRLASEYGAEENNKCRCMLHEKEMEGMMGAKDYAQQDIFTISWGIIDMCCGETSEATVKMCLQNMSY